MQRPEKVKTVSSRNQWPNPGVAFVAGAFFVGYFLYVWLRIQPSLVYYGSAPPFLLNTGFFRPFLARPGGLADYVGAWLTQGHYYDALGAMVFTATGGLVFLATRVLLGRLATSFATTAPYVPAFLLLLLQSDYDLPAMAVGVGLGLALWLGVAYAGLTVSRKAAPLPHPAKSMVPTNPQEPAKPSGNKVWFPLAACGMLAAGLFHLAGFWPCLLFALLAGSIEAGPRRRSWLGLGCLLCAFLGPLGLAHFAVATPLHLFKPPAQGAALLVFLALHLCVPIAVGVQRWWPGALLPAPGTPAVKPAGQTTGWLFRPGRALWLGRIIRASLFVLGWGLVWRALDGQRKEFLQIGCYTDQRQWDKALAVGVKLGQVTPASTLNVVRALFHTGRLPENLFAYSVPAHFDLMPGLSGGLAACRAQSETLLELGHVNLAERLAHEALEYEGERPETLKLLARINLLKGRPAAARIFLNVLCQVPFQRAWAEHYLQRLAVDPEVSDDGELAELRRRRVATDQPGVGVSTASLLRQLLHSNPRNQMAFEYLMIHFLLTLQLDKLVAELGRLDDFGYRDLPRHYEEALVRYQYQPDSRPVELRGRRIRPETARRFAQFVELVNRGGLASAADRQALRRDFGNTYWYYHLFAQAAGPPQSPPPAKP